MLSDQVLTRISRSLGATGLRVWGKVNVPIYRASKGRLMGSIGKAPVLLLTTTGRKSGQARTAPVVYLADGERLIVIGSNAGHKPTPGWVFNLRSRPEAEVEFAGKRKKVLARVAEGDERTELWRRMNDQYSGFDVYARSTERDIALFVLDPR